MMSADTHQWLGHRDIAELVGAEPHRVVYLPGEILAATPMHLCRITLACGNPPSLRVVREHNYVGRGDTVADILRRLHMAMKLWT